MSHKHTSSEHLPIALIASLVVVWFALFALGTYGHLALNNTLDDSCFVLLGNTVPPPSEDLLKALRAREEELARAEHDRWMTWRVLKGWREGAVRDNAKKLHPDLCDYDQLAEGTKEKDRANIRVIPELLKQGRLVAMRLTRSE